MSANHRGRAACLLCFAALGPEFVIAQAQVAGGVANTGVTSTGATSTVVTSSEVTTKETPLAFRSGATLVPVTVVVRDAHGKAIGNFGRDDFRLFDNGKPQMISRFTVESLAGDPTAARESSSGTKAAPPATTDLGGDGIPDRFVAYIFDDLHLSPAELIYTRDAAKRQFDAALHPLERVAIYAISGNPMQEFTGDREKLHAALARIGTGNANANKSSQQAACPPATYYMGDLIYNKNQQQPLDVVTDDAMFCANLPPDQRPRAVQMAKDAARAAVMLGDRDTVATLDTIRNVIARIASMPGQRTIVMVSPGFLVLNDYRDQQTALIDQAIRSNVVIGGLDARGLYVANGMPDASEHVVNTATMVAKSFYNRTETITQTDVMATLADGTGGVFSHGANDFDEELARTASAPEFLYVLGFSPLELKMDGRYHNLKVALAPGASPMNVQFRKGYYAPAHATDPAEQARQQIEETFFSRDQIRDLPAVLQTQYFRADNGEVRLSATAEIDVKKLAYRRDGDRNRDDITVVTGVFDGDGNYVSGAQKIVEMRLLDETLAKRLDSGIGVKNSFTVHPGRYVVRMVVRDSEGQLMAAQSNVVEIP